MIYQGVRTLDELHEVIDDYLEFDEFTFDVETTGEHKLDPQRNKIFWISLAGPGRADVIPCGHPHGEIIEYDDEFHRINPANKHYQEHRINETSGRLKWFDIPTPYMPPPPQLWLSDVIEPLRPLFFKGNRRKVGQNVKFDLLSIAKYFGDIPPPPYGDTLVAAKLIDENFTRYDLGSLAKREFNFSYDKIGKNVEDYPFSAAYLYSYLDAKFTWLLWSDYSYQLEEEGVRHIFDLEMDLLPVIMDMENTGVAIDEKSLDSLSNEFNQELANLYLAINDVYEPVYNHDINLNAKRQVAELVYGILGKKCTVFTEKTQEPSTAAETLEAFARNKTVAKVLEYAKLKKLQSTFVDGLRDKITPEGRIHASFNQVGTVSGRMSSSQPNLQNIPARSVQGKRIREVFVAGKGNVLVASDLSQIELRMLAHFTKDRGLVKAYQENQDLHGLTAATAFGKDYTPLQRGLAKNSNFALLYGAGPATMVRRYEIPSIKMAKQLTESFYMTFPRVEAWKQEILRDARQRYQPDGEYPHVLTILGRKRRLPQLRSSDRQLRSAAERQAISVTISGSAADLFKVVMINCYEELQKQSWEGHILMTVHDEIVVEVPEKYAEEALALVKEVMENVTNPFTGEPILSIPIVAESKILKRWSEMK